MKKIIALLSATVILATIVFSITSCGEEKDYNENHANTDISGDVDEPID